MCPVLFCPRLIKSGTYIHSGAKKSIVGHNLVPQMADISVDLIISPEVFGLNIFNNKNEQAHIYGTLYYILEYEIFLQFFV